MDKHKSILEILLKEVFDLDYKYIDIKDIELVLKNNFVPCPEYK